MWLAIFQHAQCGTVGSGASRDKPGSLHCGQSSTFLCWSASSVMELGILRKWNRSIRQSCIEVLPLGQRETVS